MKSRKFLLGAALVLASLMAQQAVAAIAFSFTNSSIRNSKHDLSSSSTTTGPKAASTAAAADEVCVFCHTPHGADFAKGPLWNRGGTTTITNAYSNPDTMDSAVLASFATSSAACMTCHDGSTALDNLINASGSGGYTAGGVSRNYGAAGATMGPIAAGVTAITGDLRDDHPIGVAYCGGFLGGTGGCVDSDFVVAANSGQTVAALVKNGTAGATAAVNSTVATDKYWIDTDGTTTSRSKQDLTLFVRAFTQTVNSGNQPAVECASCHDVHNSGNGTFLRVSNLKSALCFACHNK